MEHFTVLMVVPRFDEIPGKWTYFKEMACRLRKNGNEVIVLSPRLYGFDEHDVIEGVEVYRVKSLYIESAPLLIPDPLDLFSKLSQILKRKIDLVYDTSSASLPVASLVFLYLVLIGRRMPWVTHIHGELRDFQDKRVIGFLFETYLNVFSRILLTFSDRVLVAGERIIPRALTLGVNVKKLKVVRVGMRYPISKIEEEPPTTIDKAKVKSALGVREEDFLIGYVGRLSPGKNVDVIIRAVKILAEKEVRVRLLVVGSGTEESSLKALVINLNLVERVFFLGWRNDVPKLMQAMDAFATTSVSEAGISASLLEAMLAGLPCIVTPFTNLIQSYVNGLVVPFDDSQSLAKAIELLTRNDALRAMLSRNARKDAICVSSNYAWDKYVSAMQRSFTEVVIAHGSH